MPWTKPEFVEIPLGMEVTAYANTDGKPAGREPKLAGSQEGQGNPPQTSER